MVVIVKQTLKNLSPVALRLIILLAVLQALVTLLTYGFSLSFDEAIWHYIGRNWFRHGMVPYTGGVDNKSPLIFAVFGLSDILFGVNYWFPRLLGTTCQTAGLYYVYKIAKHLSGEQAGILAVSFYGLSLLWHGTGGRYVAFTETYEALFVIIAVYQCIATRDTKSVFIGGLMGGIGLAFRLSALFGILAVVIVLLRNNKNYALAFCAGVLVSIGLLTAAGFIAGIDVQAFFTYGFADNFGSGSATDHSFSWKMESLSDKFFYSEMILFYPLVLAYIFIKKRVDLFVLWAILAFIGINMVGIYGDVHLRDMLPALALMSAFAVNYLIDEHSLPLKPVMIIIWLSFFPKLWEPLANIKKLLTDKPESVTAYGHPPYDKPDEASRKKLGEWIKANTADTDKVFIAGYGAQVQAYSERISPTIYFNATQTALAKQRFFKDLRINKASIIAIPLFAEYEQMIAPDMRNFVSELVKKDYTLYGNRYNYNIYKIKLKIK